MMLTHKRTVLSLVIQTTLAVSFASSAMAQEAEADADKERQDAEIIEVTGTGFTRSANDVPMNITAIDETELRKNNITDLKDLLANAVEINAPGNSARFADSVTVRGLNVSPVNANNLEQFVKSTLSYYLDDTPLPNIAYRIKDVERVETLLGPQGTLYGAGSLGGTVRYITNKPQLDSHELKVNSGFYQTDSAGISSDVDTVINLPFGDRVAVRLNGASLDEKGYTDRISNPAFRTGTGGYLDLPALDGRPDNNQSIYKNDDWQKVKSGRLAVLIQASENMTLQLNHLQQSQLAHGFTGASLLPVHVYCNDDPTCIDNTSSYDTSYQYNDRTVVSRYDEYADRDFLLDSFEIDYSFSTFKLHSVTARFEDMRQGQADYAGPGESFYGAWIPDLSLYNPNNSESAYMTFNNSFEGVTHETRLTSTDTRGFTWIAGFFYTQQERHYKFSEWFPTLDQVLTDSGLWFGADRAFVGGRVDEGYTEDLASDYTEKALFGEIGYDVTERWNVTLGARYFNYQDEGRSFVDDYAGDLINVDFNVSSTADSDAFYKFNTAYKLGSDSLLYATYSQGFRRGGINGFKPVNNQAVDPDVLNYTPDSIDNYELGAKSSFLDNRLYMQIATYHMKWNDTQTYFAQQVPDQFGVGIDFPINGTTNGPDSVSEGVELHTRWRATDNLKIQFASATTEAAWDETKTVCTYENPADNRNADCVTWMKGGNLGGAPKWKHNLSIDYTAFWGGYSLWAGMSVRYTGAVQNDRQDNPTDPVIKFADYTLYNANLGIGKDHWELSFWINNITDETPVISSQNDGEFGRRVIFTQPRTIGATFSYAFGE